MTGLVKSESTTEGERHWEEGREEGESKKRHKGEKGRPTSNFNFKLLPLFAERKELLMTQRTPSPQRNVQELLEFMNPELRLLQQSK